MRFLPFLCILSCADEKINIPDTTGEQEIISDRDGDGYLSDEDCDDSDPFVNPSEEETCDGVDNNCNGQVDEGVLSEFYEDQDGDGFGDENSILEACQIPEGYVNNGNDCNDQNSLTYPGAPEQCDDADNDCDEEVDEDIVEQWFYDADGDGYGNPEDSIDTCLPDEGYVDNDEDCDDELAISYP